jgi:hypothetical protein
LSCLDDKRERQRFFSLLPCNILTRDEAIRVCCLFNGLSEEAYEYYQAHAEGLHHPFCDLHRVGLLGTIAREPDSGRSLQRFKQPHDFLTDLESSLPDSPYYLLHPALDEHIRQLRTGPAYHLFQHIIVGDGQPWEDCFDVFCGLERSLFTLDDGAAQDAAYELLNTARVVLASDRKLHLRSILEASADLKLLRQRSAGPSGDDLSFWLDELISLGDG